MNTISLITLSVLIVAGHAARAAEATEFSIPASTLSRAEVLAELAQHQARGEYAIGAAADQQAFAPITVARSRADVKTELALAMASDGWVRNQDAEQQPFVLATSPRSRDEVRAEARQHARRTVVDPLYVA